MNITVRLMPSSPDTDLDKIKKAAEKIVETQGGIGIKFSEEPIAFGLKAIILTCTWPEEKELESMENSLREIEYVNSAEITDIRRAVG